MLLNIFNATTQKPVQAEVKKIIQNDRELSVEMPGVDFILSHPVYFNYGDIIYGSGWTLYEYKTGTVISKNKKTIMDAKAGALINWLNVKKANSIKISLADWIDEQIKTKKLKQINF